MRILLIVSLLALAACDFTKDFDPWGTASKENCDRYGNNCQPICTLYGNCETEKEEIKSCELYGNCDSGGGFRACELYGNCED